MRGFDSGLWFDFRFILFWRWVFIPEPAMLGILIELAVGGAGTGTRSPEKEPGTVLSPQDDYQSGNALYKISSAWIKPKYLESKLRGFDPTMK